jgi:hypothetical protein
MLHYRAGSMHTMPLTSTTVTVTSLDIADQLLPPELHVTVPVFGNVPVLVAFVGILT